VFGTRIAETILASVHVRARKQAGHMDASDLIRALPKLTLRGGGRPHMESCYSIKPTEWRQRAPNRPSASATLASGNPAVGANATTIHW
jgi:hypothetical protein